MDDDMQDDGPQFPQRRRCSVDTVELFENEQIVSFKGRLIGRIILYLEPRYDGSQSIWHCAHPEGYHENPTRIASERRFEDHGEAVRFLSEQYGRYLDRHNA